MWCCQCNEKYARSGIIISGRVKQSSRTHRGGARDMTVLLLQYLRSCQYHPLFSHLLARTDVRATKSDTKPHFTFTFRIALFLSCVYVTTERCTCAWWRELFVALSHTTVFRCGGRQKHTQTVTTSLQSGGIVGKRCHALGVCCCRCFFQVRRPFIPLTSQNWGTYI